jgi:hypothetical protein
MGDKNLKNKKELGILSGTIHHNSEKSLIITKLAHEKYFIFFNS